MQGRGSLALISRSTREHLSHRKGWVPERDLWLDSGLFSESSYSYTISYRTHNMASALTVHQLEKRDPEDIHQALSLVGE